MDSQPQNDGEIPNIQSECVKEEFCKWFENRGLLSELRAYMRQLMVKALQEQNSNSKSSRKIKAASSPKLQAINLLLVDYLFHEDYLYTVSVFASEAQILASLPQYSRYVSETVQQQRWDLSCLPRFSRQEAEDILDSLRLPPSRLDMEQAIQMYLSGEESLLTCVARTLASQHTSSPLCNTDAVWSEVVEGSYQLWSNEMQNLLLTAGVKLQHILRMQHKWKCIIEEEKRKSREDSEKEQLIQQAEWEEMLREKVREDLEGEWSLLQKRDRELQVLANQISEVQQDVSERLAQLQEKSVDLQERESQMQTEKELLVQKMSNIQEKEEILTLTKTNLMKNLSEAKCHFVDASTQLQMEVATCDASVQVSESASAGPAPLPVNEVVSTHTQTVITMDDHEQQTSSSLELDTHSKLLLMEKEKFNELQEENMELRANALQQRQRIDELTNRAASLSSQLENSQIALTLPNGRRGEQSVPRTQPVPALPSAQATFVAPTFGLSSPQRQGAGEQSLFTPRPRQAESRTYRMRRPSRFAFSNNPTPVSEESSPTDEVIQNARLRLQQLDAESVTAQRNYQSFQTRLLNSDSIMFPSLSGVPKTADPLLRVRRFDMMPSASLSTNHPPLHTNTYQPRERHTQSPEEEDDSSSDQSLFYTSGRIENFANARRMFTERNIRHFERWKQFKKKFQRRTGCDQYRRNLTSSSDDEDNYRKPRRRNEIATNSKKDYSLGNQERSKSNEFGNLNKTEFTENDKKLLTKEDELQQKNIPILTINGETPPVVEKSGISPKITTKDDRLKTEQSMLLIESVKILLEAQNLMNETTASSNFSNESLVIQSLHKDDGDSAQNKTATQTHNMSALTVRRADPVTQELPEEKKNEEGRVLSVTDNNSLSHEHVGQEEFLLTRGAHEKDSTCKSEEGRRVIVESSPVPLNVPHLRLVSPACNAEIEDRINSVEVARQDSGEVGTSSMTSASDIIRELNPSKDSSEGLVSVGNDSHTEDFWN